MKIYQCDICKIQVNDFGCWGGEKPRNMYELKLIHDTLDNNGNYDGFIICDECFKKIYLNKEDKDV